MRNLFIFSILASLFAAGSVYAAGVIFPTQGGTGTSTVPIYGQMLVGNAGGTYTLTATSSLGISGSGGTPGGSSGQVQYNGSGAFAGVATSSLSIGTTLQNTGTFGSLVGGTNASISLNLANPNTWTALQQLQGNASTTALSVYNNAYFGATATSSFSSSGVLALAGITSSLLKTNGSNQVVAATAGTDYQAPITATWPITLSSNTVGFNGLSTSTAAVIGNIPYFSGVNTLANVATTSFSTNSSLSYSGTLGALVGGASGSLSLNLANPNTWSALQQFQGQASSTQFSCYGPCYFGATATSTFTTAGRLGILNSSPSYPLDVSGFINTDQYSGYKQNGNTVLYASTTNNSLAIGSSAAAGWMSATSTSFQDISIGSGSMMATPINSAAINNVAIGFQAYQNNTSGAGNVALGTNALRANTSGSNNMSIGSYSLAAVTTAHDNVGIGTNALGNDTTGNADTIIGSNAGQAELGNNNTFIGYGAGQGSGTPSDTGNVFLGAFSGNQNTGSFLNTCVGYFSCYNLTSGNGNVSIGDGANVISPTGSNQLNLANVLYGTNIYGAFSQSSSPTTNGTLGVSTSTTFSKFAVSLNSSDTLGYAFVVSSSTASATTTPFGVSNTGWIVTSGGLPTASACGTTQSISGNQTSGDVMLTGAAVTTCTINFPNPVPAGTTLQCTVTDNSTVSTVSITATTTSSFTAGFPTGLNTATIWWQCTASRNANN